MNDKTATKTLSSMKSVKLAGVKIGQKTQKDIAKRRAANKTAAKSRAANRA